jgi:hypothetical protein
VKRIGARLSAEQSSTETLMARFRIVPNMTPAMRTAADQHRRTLVDNARMFALAAMMSDDFEESMSESKVHYSFWRPVTAIRNADQDGNPATAVDPSWLPLMTTPNHGEYPCGHCGFAGATAELMTALGGENPKWACGSHPTGSRAMPSRSCRAGTPGWPKSIGPEFSAESITASAMRRVRRWADGSPGWRWSGRRSRLPPPRCDRHHDLAAADRPTLAGLVAAGAMVAGIGALGQSVREGLTDWANTAQPMLGMMPLDSPSARSRAAPQRVAL